MEFTMNLKKEDDDKSITQVKGLHIILIEQVKSLVIGIPKGLKWDKDDKEFIGRDKNTFFRLYETYKEHNNGIKRDTLPKPWDEGAYLIIKYLTCAWRLCVVHAYHFRFFHQLRNLYYQKLEQSIIIPYFLLNLLIEMSLKVQAGVIPLFVTFIFQGKIQGIWSPLHYIFTYYLAFLQNYHSLYA